MTILLLYCFYYFNIEANTIPVLVNITAGSRRHLIYCILILNTESQTPDVFSINPASFGFYYQVILE